MPWTVVLYFIKAFRPIGLLPNEETQLHSKLYINTIVHKYTKYNNEIKLQIYIIYNAIKHGNFSCQKLQ